jgi:glycine cleavage system aminomethyltransferase T
MQACADLILDLGLYWVKFLDKDFIGRRQLRMQQSWFKNMKIVKNVQETRSNLHLSPS